MNVFYDDLWVLLTEWYFPHCMSIVTVTYIGHALFNSVLKLWLCRSTSLRVPFTCFFFSLQYLFDPRKSLTDRAMFEKVERDKQDEERDKQKKLRQRKLQTAIVKRARAHDNSQSLESTSKEKLKQFRYCSLTNIHHSKFMWCREKGRLLPVQKYIRNTFFFFLIFFFQFCFCISLLISPPSLKTGFKDSYPLPQHFSALLIYSITAESSRSAF